MINSPPPDSYRDSLCFVTTLYTHLFNLVILTICKCHIISILHKTVMTNGDPSLRSG
jgi:hypothetical protein